MLPWEEGGISMGIYLPNMEMPRKGEMLVVFPDGTAYVCFNGMRERLSQTEAVPVPPHGRLGDLDKLEQMFSDIDNAPYSSFDGSEPFYSAEDAAQIIRLAPTIIPGEEEAP